MFKEALAATALATATISPAGAQGMDRSAPVEVSVGMLDVYAPSIIGVDRNTKVEYREFTRPGMQSGRWKSANGYDHGETMATIIVNQIRSMDKDAKINIYAANATEMHPKSNGALIFNPEGAKAALQWFKEHNVKVVMTTMVGRDSPAMREFMAEATRLDMTVYASAGNEMPKDVKAYPAAYPEAISIAGDNGNLAFRHDPSVSRYVNFTMNGEIMVEAGNASAFGDQGSSMASARASAIGAYAIAVGKAHDTESLRSVMQAMAETKSYKVKGVQVTASYVEYREAGPRLAAVRQREAKIEEGPAIAVLAAMQKQAGVGR